MSLSLESRQVNKTTATLTIAGRVTIMDGVILQQTVRRLMAEGARYVVINMASLSHMDSFGLGQLIATYLSVRDAGGDVKLVSPTPAVKDLLRNTRLDTVLQIFTAEDEALASIP